MQHIMVDLETLGTRAGSVILSIGAVEFDQRSKELGCTFYRSIQPEDCKAHGLTVDQSTLDWWEKKSPEARAVLTDPDAVPLSDALDAFVQFWVQTDAVFVWGNGADFDNVLLAHAFHAVDRPIPWKFWDNRCYRTLKNVRPHIKMGPRQGTFHNALDDAITQATHCIDLLQGVTHP